MRILVLLCGGLRTRRAIRILPGADRVPVQHHRAAGAVSRPRRRIRELAQAAALQRLSALLDRVREMSGLRLYARVESENNFPTGTGIASFGFRFRRPGSGSQPLPPAWSWMNRRFLVWLAAPLAPPVARCRAALSSGKPVIATKIPMLSRSPQPDIGTW